MDVKNFLESLVQNSIYLWTEDGSNIKFKAAQGKLEKNTLLKIKQNKEEILNYFVNDGHCCYPLSFGQQQMMFIYELNKKSSAYNNVFAARILSEIDVNKFFTAFKRITAKHAILRTVYIRENEGADFS